MTEELFIRGFFSGIMSLALAWVLFSRYDHEIGYDGENAEGQKYLPYVNGALLPVCLLTLTILSYFEYGATGAVQMSISGCFSIFLQICLYYTFTFSYELAEPFCVVVSSWDYSSSYTVSQTEMKDSFSMPLPDYPAHYAVYASFRDKNGNIYEAEFRFNIGSFDSM